MKKQTVFQKYGIELRKLQFKKTFDTRAGGCRCCSYEKTIDAVRTLDLQVWADGQHRVTHNIRGCTATTPTEFHNIAQMHTAIAHETTRTDNKYLDGAQ